MYDDDCQARTKKNVPNLYVLLMRSCFLVVLCRGGKLLARRFPSFELAITHMHHNDLLALTTQTLSQIFHSHSIQSAFRCMNKAAIPAAPALVACGTAENQ